MTEKDQYFVIEVIDNLKKEMLKLCKEFIPINKHKLTYKTIRKHERIKRTKTRR